MHRNRETTLDKFERALRSSIARKLGRKISAQRFADQYNLRAHGTETISRETARKWLRGTTIPDYERLSVLIQWLDMDPIEFLHPGKPETHPLKSDPTAFLNRDRQTSLEDLMAIAKSLDDQSAEALFITAWALQQARKLPPAVKET